MSPGVLVNGSALPDAWPSIIRAVGPAVAAPAVNWI